jgi:hypothetical protein
MTPESELEEAISLCSKNNRICPIPKIWNELYLKLPHRKIELSGRMVPQAPLILAAWWDTADRDKQERFHEHLIYAYDHDVLGKVTNFLAELDESEWHHLGD